MLINLASYMIQNEDDKMEQKSSQSNILITGMFLQTSCSMIKVRRANPDIDGSSTSVNTRSMLWGLPFNVSHAFNPSETAATV